MREIAERTRLLPLPCCVAVNKISAVANEATRARLALLEEWQLTETAQTEECPPGHRDTLDDLRDGVRAMARRSG